MVKPIRLHFASSLAASASDVWTAVATMRGVNAELGPWLRMTVPAAHLDTSLDDVPVREPLFASWILFAGIPIDRHMLALESVTPGRGFREQSWSWTERRWVHARSVTPASDSTCVLTDELELTPRLGCAGAALARIVTWVFRHRHARLRARFGSIAGAAQAIS